jgi:uncharacterized RDD family membrane protein YckC
MKVMNKHMPNQIADFVVQRDIFGQIRNTGLSLAKKIKPKSTKAPDLAVNYAGLGLRALATLLDLVIFSSAILVLEMILFPSAYLEINYTWYSVLINLFLWICYNGLSEGSVHQATFGKMIFKIKVIDLNGNRISRIIASLRSMITIISILPIGLGIWYITTDSKKRSWHDLIAGTYVIKS